MSRHETSQLLKTWALEAGFDRVGVAAMHESEHGQAFLRWLARGEHAAMGYLERRVECRLDPASLLPGARSVLCVALQYYPVEQSPVAGDLWPRVARYARGEDYHQLMGRRLDAVARRIRERFPGCATRPYVDTGPVLERELAARAGLGAFGKNTNLLHPEAGSWFLLGELLLTLELSPDRPLADLCGTCTRCLEACPTGALPEAYHLDSSRCISYWTIEHRGAIPLAARETVGEWAFGCDICQEVCPLNAAPTGARLDEFGLPKDRAELDLAALLLLDRDEYIARFRGSPMKRAKREGLQRNAAVAMGNRGDARYIEPLSRALEGSSALVRGHAAWALGRIGGDRARGELEGALGGETDAEVRSEIEEALRRLGASG